MPAILTWLLEQAASLLWRRWFKPKSDVEKAHAIEDGNSLKPDGAAADKLRADWSK